MPNATNVSMQAKIMAATHSMRSWPYWCSSSEALLDNFTPAITTKVLNTSEAEWTPSEIMAADWAIKPAASLAKLSTRLATMLFKETIMAMCSSSFAYFINKTSSKSLLCRHDRKSACGIVINCPADADYLSAAQRARLQKPMRGWPPDQFVL